MATATRHVIIESLMGLHVRPATAICMFLQKNGATGTIEVDGESVPCTPLALMMAAEKFPQGTEIGFTITHENPEPLADELAAMFAARFNVPGD